MLRDFQSIDDARRVFDPYAAIEPRLNELWRMCRWATPPRRDVENDFDDVDTDGGVDKSWCAEVYFFQEVKPRLMLLVGWYRTREPDVLKSATAYDDVYAALFYALQRNCACCHEEPEDERQEEWAREMTERMHDG
jgi:hypothetical protein